MNNTGISWTDISSNSLRYRNAAGQTVHACVKVSSGCASCYSEAIAQNPRMTPKGWATGQKFTAENMRGLTPFLDEKEIHRLLTSKTLTGKKVFMCDMTDLFGEWVPFELIDRIFAVMALRPDVTFQVLTKRPERMAEYLESAYKPGSCFDEHIKNGGGITAKEIRIREMVWPLPNVWAGTSVENQAMADKRIPHLLACPAVVRFLSVEPILGPVDLAYSAFNGTDSFGRMEGISWVIVGAESGKDFRSCDPAWIESVVEQCASAGVACWVKQDSAFRPGQQGRLSDATFAVKQFPKEASADA